MADDGAERDRGVAGRHRSRDGGAVRRYTANAAIGVSWQVIIIVIVFISSLFSGMGVLVSRFAGANEPEKVNRVVYQAFITALALSVLMAVVGYFSAPALLNLVKAAPKCSSRPCRSCERCFSASSA
jgi:Na+-driven multidrug efflux pump